MSVRTDLIEVVCDGPDDQTECPDNAAMADYGTACSVRAVLRTGEDAWRTAIPGGIDRCAKCREQARVNCGSNPAGGAL
jgi:hypothetical protein